MPLDVDAYWCSWRQFEEVRMEGVVWRLYRDKQGGLIRGNDGLEIPFRRAALAGVDFQALFAGQRVCYRVQTGWWGPEAVEVQPKELRCQPFRH